MKKLLIVAAILLIFLSSNLYAQDTGLYIGIGGNYALQNIDTTDVNNDLRAYGLQLDFSNAYGFNGKVGYHFSKLFAVELAFDYFNNLSWNQTVTISGKPATFEANLKLMTLMLAGKLSPNIGSEVVRPFIIAGVGNMFGNIDVKTTYAGYRSTASNSNSDACGKIGVGIDFYATRNISIGVEGSYVMGFGGMSNMKYTNIDLGVAYHF